MKWMDVGPDQSPDFEKGWSRYCFDLTEGHLMEKPCVTDDLYGMSNDISEDGHNRGRSKSVFGHGRLGASLPSRWGVYRILATSAGLLSERRARLHCTASVSFVFCDE